MLRGEEKRGEKDEHDAISNFGKKKVEISLTHEVLVRRRGRRTLARGGLKGEGDYLFPSTARKKEEEGVATRVKLKEKEKGEASGVSFISNSPLRIPEGGGGETFIIVPRPDLQTSPRGGGGRGILQHLIGRKREKWCGRIFSTSLPLMARLIRKRGGTIFCLRSGKRGAIVKICGKKKGASVPDCFSLLSVDQLRKKGGRKGLRPRNTEARSKKKGMMTDLNCLF